MCITPIPMTPGNRMIRLGAGQHNHRWFIRLDLWWYGFRITFSKEKHHE